MNSVLNYKDIDTLIFDFGSVIIQPMDLLSSLKSSKIPDEYIYEINSKWRDIESTSEHYDIKKFINIIGHSLSQEASVYVPDVLNIILEKNIPFDFSEKLIKDLKNKGYKVYYLSNWAKWNVDLLRDNGNFDICKLFDGGIFSGDVDYRKPSYEIYKLLIDRYNINPLKSIFFDDRLDNIIGAKYLNINGILFSTKNPHYTVSCIYDYFIYKNMNSSIKLFHDELKHQLESTDDGVYIIKPSMDKEELDKSYQLYNSQNSDQKQKADTRSLSLYGMNNYDHYHILLSKIKHGTKDDELNGLEYDPHDEILVKEEYDIYNLPKDFNCESIKELDEKIEAAREFNIHTIGRVIIFPTQDLNELESLYMKYMALDLDNRTSSDNKSQEIFGKSNRDTYSFIKDNIIKPKQNDIEDTHTVEDEELEKDNNSVISNDLPLLTPDELKNIDEDYSCFNIEDANIIKEWRESYINMNSDNYKYLNLARLDILRKSIYENNIDGIIQCGWIPGIEFNLNNRSKTSNIVKQKITTCITEAKSFPIQFDKDGNLIIKNIKKINYEQEYSNSHRLLIEYDKTKSYEPMKFELAKMQFFITLLEKKIYNKDKKKVEDELKVRARFLNDFKKYLNIIISNEKTFNFAQYYEQSPFNDALIQIDKSTLKYGWKALKYIIKENNIALKNIDIIISDNLPIEETAIITSENIRNLKIYIRNALEASRGSTVNFEQHGPSFKVLQGSKILADVVVPTKLPVNPSDIVIKGVIPSYALSFVIDFAIKNSGNIRALWDTSRDSKNYEKIIKRIIRNNPDCKIRINKNK